MKTLDEKDTASLVAHLERLRARAKAAATLDDALSHMVDAELSLDRAAKGLMPDSELRDRCKEVARTLGSLQKALEALAKVEGVVLPSDVLDTEGEPS